MVLVVYGKDRVERTQTPPVDLQACGMGWNMDSRK